MSEYRSPDYNIARLEEKIESLESRLKLATEALKMLYEETVDYITINNLGDPHHNQSMRLAAEALRRIREESGKIKEENK